MTMTPAGHALTRALNCCLADFPGMTSIEDLKSEDWASVTFSGARHEIGLRIEGDEADAFAAAFISDLPDHEFALRGHILADIALLSRESRDDGRCIRLRLEALTVEDAA